MENNNLELWNKVEKTDPKYTKPAKVGGLSITAIDPHYQIMKATEFLGIYGEDWGFRKIILDYNLVEKYDLVVFKGEFFHKGGSFEIINSVKLFMNNAKTMLDDNFAKKVETDTLTKALSKLGFNADVFLGKFNDLRYVEEVKKEFGEADQQREIERYKATTKTNIENTKTLEELKTVWASIPSEWQKVFNEIKENQKNKLTNK